jgi:hypothetical protein
MRYKDATSGRNHRRIEGLVALSTSRVASHAGVERAMCFDLLSKGALSNV